MQPPDTTHCGALKGDGGMDAACKGSTNGGGEQPESEKVLWTLVATAIAMAGLVAATAGAEMVGRPQAIACWAVAAAAVAGGTLIHVVHEDQAAGREVPSWKRRTAVGAAVVLAAGAVGAAIMMIVFSFMAGATLMQWLHAPGAG